MDLLQLVAELDELLEIEGTADYCPNGLQVQAGDRVSSLVTGVTASQALIDAAAADIIHGHSSHHPLGIEVYRDRPILYGCGDLIDDYEGISRYEAYRADLALLYLVRLERATGALRSLEMVPMHREKFRLGHAGEADRQWLHQVLGRECDKLRAGVRMTGSGSLQLQWQ